MLDSLILIVLVSFFMFFYVFRKISALISSQFQSYVKLLESKKIEWDDRNNSTIHAGFIVILCVLVLILDDEGYQNPLWGDSWMGKAVLSVSVGYVLSDILFMLMYLSTSSDVYWGTLLHHICMMCTFSCCVFYGAYLHLCIVRTLAECSTPFINIRWILYTCNMQKSKRYLYNGCVMTLVFFLFRLVAMPYCYIRVYNLKDSNEFEKLGNLQYLSLCAILVDCLNVMWFAKIIRGMVKYLNLSSKDS